MKYAKIDLLISAIVTATVWSLLNAIPLITSEMLLLDLKQKLSFTRPKGDDFLSVNLPIRGEKRFPHEYFELDRDLILNGIARISAHSPKAIILISENGAWKSQPTDSQVHEFVEKLNSYENLYHYQGRGNYYFPSDPRMALGLRNILDHWDFTTDHKKPPYDGKSRYFNLVVHQNNIEGTFLPFLRAHGFDVSVSDFKWVVEYLGTTQALIKYFPVGSFAENENLAPEERYKNKIIFVGFADPMNLAMVDTPISSKTTGTFSAETLGRHLMRDQDYLANLMANLSYKTYVKILPTYVNQTYAVFCVFILSVLAINSTNASRVGFTIGWIAFANIFPFLLFWCFDVFLHSIPVAAASILVPYFILPVVLFRSFKRAALDRIASENSIESIRSEGIVVTKSAQADAKFRTAARLAHDIRGPLSALRIAAHGMKEDERSRELIQKSINRIDDIASSLLVKGKEMADFGMRQTQLADIAEVISDLKVHVSTVAPDIKFVGQNRASSSYVSIQKTELERHLMNLVTNSIEAHRSSSNSSQEPFIEVDFSHEETNLIVTVNDNGPGIPTHMRSEIFRSGVTFGKSDGHGIGLSSARAFVQSQGGTIELNSTQLGCSISLKFPAKMSEAQIFIQGFIVIVDDDEEVLEMFARQLKGYENKVVTSDPSVAISELSNRKGPITVVSDLIFSNSNLIGFDILRASPFQSLRYLYTTLGSEPSVISVAEKANIVVIDKARIPVLIFP